MRAFALLPIALAAFAGQSPDMTSFEVASVKPADPAARAIHCAGGPGTESPGAWRCANVPLAFVIPRACGFEAYQFSPREACCQDRFDFNAKIPPGATKEQFQRMLQNLLVERFHFRFHYEQKEMPLYELTIAEGGPKLKATAPAELPPQEDPWGPPHFSLGADGCPVFPDGRGGLTGGANGCYRWKAFAVPLDEIAKTLSFHLGRKVVDSTGLRGKYDFDLTWWIDLAWLTERAGLRDAIPEAADSGPRGPSLIRAVEAQLGLKLTSKKGPASIVVVDHVDKVPAGN